MGIEFRLLGAADQGVLSCVADEVFDEPLQPRLIREFLEDARHHLAVAIDGTCVVGVASGVHYVHPDKPPELWINEVGVAPSHQRRGIGRELLQLLLEAGRAHGCEQAWVLTERENVAAMQLYAAAGGSASDTVMFDFDLRQR